jgi:hypothetical protein
VRLLSPQHWARSQTNTKTGHTFGERSDAHKCVLFWENGTHQRTVELGRRDNVATFTLAPGFHNSEAFCCEAGLADHQQNPIALPTGTISDDKGDEDDNAASVGDTDQEPPDHEDDMEDPVAPSATPSDQPTTVDVRLDGPATTDPEGEGTASTTSTTNVIVDEEDRQPGDLAALLQIHHQYGHISMRKRQEMARQGIILRRLAKCRVPTDNGIFKAHQWMQACRDDQQGMTFAGVNAHHQNGHAERRIRELQELARAMLIHANARWKDSITPNL